MKKTNSQPLKLGTSSQKLKDRKEFLQLLAEKLAFVYKLNATEAKVLFFCFANLTFGKNNIKNYTRIWCTQFRV